MDTCIKIIYMCGEECFLHEIICFIFHYGNDVHHTYKKMFHHVKKSLLHVNDEFLWIFQIH